MDSENGSDPNGQKPVADGEQPQLPTEAQPEQSQEPETVQPSAVPKRQPGLNRGLGFSFSIGLAAVSLALYFCSRADLSWSALEDKALLAMDSGDYAASRLDFDKAEALLSHSKELGSRIILLRLQDNQRLLAELAADSAAMTSKSKTVSTSNASHEPVPTAEAQVLAFKKFAQERNRRKDRQFLLEDMAVAVRFSNDLAALAAYESAAAILKQVINDIDAVAFVRGVEPDTLCSAYPNLLYRHGKVCLERAYYIRVNAPVGSVFACLEEAYASFAKARKYAVNYLPAQSTEKTPSDSVYVWPESSVVPPVSSEEIILSMALARALQGETREAIRLLGPALVSIEPDETIRDRNYFYLLKGRVLREIGRPGQALTVLRDLVAKCVAAKNYRTGAVAVEEIYLLCDACNLWHECYGFLLDGLAQIRDADSAYRLRAAYQAGLAQFYLKMLDNPSWAENLLSQHKSLAVELKDKHFEEEARRNSLASIFVEQKYAPQRALLHCRALENWLGHLLKCNDGSAEPLLRIKQKIACRGMPSGDDGNDLFGTTADLCWFQLDHKSKQGTMGSEVCHSLLMSISKQPPGEVLWPVDKLPLLVAALKKEQSQENKFLVKSLVDKLDRSVAQLKKFYGDNSLPYALELNFLGRMQMSMQVNEAGDALLAAWKIASASKTFAPEVRRDILQSYIEFLRVSGKQQEAERLMPIFRGLSIGL